MKQRILRIVLLPVLLGLLLFVFGAVSTPQAHAAPTQVNHTVHAVSHQVQADCVAGWSQVLHFVPMLTNSDGWVWRFFPCNGVYINCWATGSSYNGNTYWDWVSWTSYYGYRYQGWMPDWGIQTYGTTLQVWSRCPLGQRAP